MLRKSLFFARSCSTFKGINFKQTDYTSADVVQRINRSTFKNRNQGNLKPKTDKFEVITDPVSQSYRPRSSDGGSKIQHNNNKRLNQYNRQPKSPDKIDTHHQRQKSQIRSSYHGGNKFNDYQQNEINEDETVARYKQDRSFRTYQKKPFKDTHLENSSYKSNSKPSNSTSRKMINYLIDRNSDVLYGVHSIKLALKGKKRVIRQITCNEVSEDSPKVVEILDEAVLQQIPIEVLGKEEFNSLFGADAVHQNIFGEVTKLNLDVIDREILKDQEIETGEYIEVPVKNATEVGERTPNSESLVNLEEESNSQDKPLLWLMAYNIIDPMNLGAVIRSSCFFGVDNIVLTKSCSRVTSVTSKASSGAVEIAPLSKVEDELSVLKQLKKNGWTLLCSSSEEQANVKRVNLQDYSFSGNVLLIIGNESKGVSEEVMDICDGLISISSRSPQNDIPCLNVSTATAVMLHSLAEARGKNPSFDGKMKNVDGKNPSFDGRNPSSDGKMKNFDD